MIVLTLTEEAKPSTMQAGPTTRLSSNEEEWI